MDPQCTVVRGKIGDYITNFMPVDEKLAVAKHCQACPDCRDYLAQMRKLLSAIHGKFEEVK
jgi:predicted anti-sigma-YlaC factor YlaD